MAGRPLKVLFVGETWNGSSARSLREAMAATNDVELDDIGDDHYRPRGRGLLVRAANRVLTPLYRRELADEIRRRVTSFDPQVLIIYKGNLVSASTLQQLRRPGLRLVNVFPDCSPHDQGKFVRGAMGQYDLVISTKPFHPPHWEPTYGYSNKCICIPHGYDPAAHYWAEPPDVQDIDVVLAASWRPQYESLMRDLAQRIPEADVSVALAGPGWERRRSVFPAHWQFPGPLFGRAYGEFVRRGKIVVAPVHSEVFVDGERQPGDEDTTRTYELAAAGTFFLHRRTPFVQTIYREDEEVALWSDAGELADKIRHYLPREAERRSLASAAHARAVPNYSVPARAVQVISHIRALVEFGKV